MNTIYIFDVDGTITVPQQKMEDEFEELFYEFCCKNEVALVSGSDKKMIEDQISSRIINKVKLYTCNGIEGSSFKLKIKDYEIDNSIVSALETMLTYTEYPVKTGNHIVRRKGMINFSIIGRNANQQERDEYAIFDQKLQHRKYLVSLLKDQFENLEFHIGGQISIDITRKGMNKSLVAKDLCKKEKPFLIFYGDGILNGGNDYPLAKYIQDNGLGYSVSINYEIMKSIVMNQKST